MRCAGCDSTTGPIVRSSPSRSPRSPQGSGNSAWLPHWVMCPHSWDTLRPGGSIADKVGLSGTSLGVGLAIIRLASLASLPLIGIADRFGRRRMILGRDVRGPGTDRDCRGKSGLLVVRGDLRLRAPPAQRHQCAGRGHGGGGDRIIGPRGSRRAHCGRVRAGGGARRDRAQPFLGRAGFPRHLRAGRRPAGRRLRDAWVGGGTEPVQGGGGGSRPPDPRPRRRRAPLPEEAGRPGARHVRRLRHHGPGEQLRLPLRAGCRAPAGMGDRPHGCRRRRGGTARAAGRAVASGPRRPAAHVLGGHGHHRAGRRAGLFGPTAGAARRVRPRVSAAVRCSPRPRAPCSRSCSRRRCVRRRPGGV